MIKMWIKIAFIILIYLTGTFTRAYVEDLLGCGTGWTERLPEKVVLRAKAEYSACNKKGIPGLFYNETECAMVVHSTMLDDEIAIGGTFTGDEMGDPVGKVIGGI